MTSSFASDNTSGIHPALLAAIEKANAGHVPAYGADQHTYAAEEAFKRLFGEHIYSGLISTGTGANVVALACLTRSFHSVVCAETAHINNDECGAPEKFTGCKLISIPTTDGKLTPAAIAPFLSFGDEHHSQPKVVSITQVTEVGTIYTPAEVRALTDFIHAHGLSVHMDGARLANAVAATGHSAAELSIGSGVDVLSFGGTKNGMLDCEAVIFADGTSQAAQDFPYLRKQAMQLRSKLRYSGAQWDAYLAGDLWLASARHANAMAQLIAEAVGGIYEITLLYPVEANLIFVELPEVIAQELLREHYFYLLPCLKPGRVIARWVTSFDTSLEAVEHFIRSIQAASQ